MNVTGENKRTFREYLILSFLPCSQGSVKAQFLVEFDGGTTQPQIDAALARLESQMNTGSFGGKDVAPNSYARGKLAIC